MSRVPSWRSLIWPFTCRETLTTRLDLTRRTTCESAGWVADYNTTLCCVNRLFFVIQHVFCYFSVPFLATAIQEELETGVSAASSSDACSAVSTVRCQSSFVALSFCVLKISNSSFLKIFNTIQPKFASLFTSGNFVHLYSIMVLCNWYVQLNSDYHLQVVSCSVLWSSFQSTWQRSHCRFYMQTVSA